MPIAGLLSGPAGWMMNVLVIDDDPAYLSLVGHAFERLGGHSVASASDSVAGLELIGDVPPDLLVMDWLMPRKSGVDILIELARRARSRRPGYVVMMTAAPDIDLLRAIASEIGADEVVSKPLGQSLVAEIAARARAGLALQA